MIEIIVNYSDESFKFSLFFYIGKFIIASTLLSKTPMPSASIECPKKSTLGSAIIHFFAFLHLNTFNNFVMFEAPF